MDDTLLKIRELIKKYIDEDIDFDTFYPDLSYILGTFFDPFDIVINEYPKKYHQELVFYSKMTGGELGEYESLIPKNPKWKYGYSNDTYGWIDKAEYKKTFTTEYNLLQIKNK